MKKTNKVYVYGHILVPKKDPIFACFWRLKKTPATGVNAAHQDGATMGLRA